MGKNLRILKTKLQQVKSGMANCTCDFLTNANDKISYYRKAKNAKFLFNKDYPEITLDWLQDRTLLSTREFLGQLLLKHHEKNPRLGQEDRLFVICKL